MCIPEVPFNLLILNKLRPKKVDGRPIRPLSSSTCEVVVSPHVKASHPCSVTPCRSRTHVGRLRPDLINVKQLTKGGSNAEAYWSPDGKRLIFQSTRGELKCDQILRDEADGSDQLMAEVL